MKNVRRMKRDKGVSPVIATILLVAITVVLVAVLYVIVSGMITSTPYTKNIGVGCKKIGTTSNYTCTIAGADAGVDWPNVGVQVLTQDGTIVGSLAKGFSFTNREAHLVGIQSPLANGSKVVDNNDGTFGVGDEIYLIAASNQSLIGLTVKLSGGGEGSATIK